MPLTPRQVEQRRSDGALLVDVRTDLQFDDAHIPGAVCIPAVRAGFGTRLAWLADRDQAIVLVGRDDEDAHAPRGSRLVGIPHRRLPPRGDDRVAARKAPVERIERSSVEDAPGAPRERRGLQLLDVRERSEGTRGTS